MTSRRQKQGRRRGHRARLAQLWPATLGGRIAVGIFGIVLLVQIVGWLRSDDDFDENHLEDFIAEKVITVTELVEATPAADRPALIKALGGPVLRVRLNSEPAMGTRPSGRFFFDEELDRRARAALEDLGSRPLKLGLRTSGLRPPSLLLSVGIDDGQWLTFRMPLRFLEGDFRHRSPSWNWLFWVALVFGVLWLSHRLASPLRRFADAADALGRDVNAPPLPVKGARELRRATRAFNRMGDRVRRMIEDRTLMLAAISHDLRTVLTRLRLRVEYIEDAEQRDKAGADIEEMQMMLDTSLSFVRGDAQAEPRVEVDLGRLLADLCADITQTMGPAVYDGPATLTYRCSAAEMRRAMGNLITNAVKYGARAHVSLHTVKDGIEVRIKDDGPGIAPEFIDQVFAPFFRIEASRNRETGGAGLGLAIARSIVRRYGGDIRLENDIPRGLIAIVRLPRTPG